jgi:hypothetical protein
MYIIPSDRRAQFTSKLYECLVRRLSVDRTLTTLYNLKNNRDLEIHHEDMCGRPRKE